MNKIKFFRSRIFITFFFLSAVARAFAQNDFFLQPATNLWRDDIGSGFNADTYSLGFQAGTGWGTRVFGDSVTHDLALGDVNASWIFTDVLAPESWYAGNLELRGELFGGAQYFPASRYLAGLTLMFRYDFATRSRFVPFLDAGAGPSATNMDSPDLGGLFEFNLQWGAGTYYFLRRNLALSTEYRWLHFSDAGITHLNNGTNTQMVEAGVTWFF